VSVISRGEETDFFACRMRVYAPYTSTLTRPDIIARKRYEARGRPYAKPIWRACLRWLSEAGSVHRGGSTDRPTSYFVFIELPGNREQATFIPLVSLRTNARDLSSPAASGPSCWAPSLSL